MLRVPCWHRSLLRGKALKRSDEREPNALAQHGELGRICAGRHSQVIRNGLKPVCPWMLN